MLREKLYSEYQKKYKEYMEKYNKIEKLQRDIADIQAEGQRKKTEIETQKKSELSKISDRKKELERQLASVKEKGVNSAAPEGYSESKLNDIEKTKDGKGCVKQFDVSRLREELSKDKEREVAKLSEQYDASALQVQESLEGLDVEYTGILQEELSYIEKDSKLCELYAGLMQKQVNNELPQAITSVLSKPTTEVIERNGINGGQRLAQIASNVSPLDDLSEYTPEWLVKLVSIVFPLMIGAGLLAVFIISGAHFGFVASVTNGILSLLFWLVIAAIVGCIGYGITEAALGMGIIGGIIGAILGFWIAMHWSVTLPYGVTNAIEWIIKILICIIVVIGVHFLNVRTSLGSMFISAGMKIDFVKKSALVQQGYAIRKNADGYYVLIRYKEIIEQIVNENKQRKYLQLTSELERLKEEKISAADSLVMKIDREIEQIVSCSEQLVNEIADCGCEYSFAEVQFDKKISEAVESIERRVSDVNVEIKTLQSKFKPEFDAIYELFEKIYRSGFCELAETRGVLSDTLYIYNAEEAAKVDEIVKNSADENRNLLPVSLHEIRHEKNPIVFLYESKDSSTIATDLFRFMDAINIGLYTINCKRIYDLYITDPKSKGINFREQQEAGRLTIVDDIKELDEIIGESMNFVASKGQAISIDEFNADLVAKGNDEEDIKKFGRYKIVQFIVPEEESVQTTDFFNNDIWTRFETSKKHGFLPIFYIKKSDWESALDDEEKFNSKFIMKLNKSLGSKQNNIFVIDTKHISVSKYN